jgi:hypothetical protein
VWFNYASDHQNQELKPRMNRLPKSESTVQRGSGSTTETQHGTVRHAWRFAWHRNGFDLEAYTLLISMTHKSNRVARSRRRFELRGTQNLVCGAQASDQMSVYKRETSFMDLCLDFWRENTHIDHFWSLRVDELDSWREDLKKFHEIHGFLSISPFMFLFHDV